MKKSVVVGLITTDLAQGAIDNLVEAEYSEKDISLVMKDVKRAREIIDDNGPLKHTTEGTLVDRLKGLKVDVEMRKNYLEEIKNGKAVLAIYCEKENLDTTKAMLADYKASDVISL